MAILATALMALLWAASYGLFRSWFAPAVIYCAVWTLMLLALTLLGSLLYPLSLEAVVCYVGAAALFVVGSLFGQSVRRPARPAPIPEVWSEARGKLIINLLLVCIILATPALVSELLASGGVSGAVAMLRENRRDSVNASGEVSSFGLLKNLPVLAQFALMMSIYIYKRGWGATFRVVLAAILWLIVSLPSGSKLIALQLPFTAAVCFAIRQRKIPWRLAAFAAALFVVVFTCGIYYINFGDITSAGGSLPFSRILAVFASYVDGGLVGFSELISGSSPIDPTQSPLRTPIYLIDAIFSAVGLDIPFELGSEHAPFLDVGPGLSGNVYTALYAYYAVGGVMGILAWSLISGLISGWVYRAVAQGRKWSLFVYPWVVYACLMSVFSEQLFQATLIVTKLLIVAGLFMFVVHRRRGSNRIRGVASRLPGVR
jgi:oligosaccharide repeat unit polymerase